MTCCDIRTEGLLVDEDEGAGLEVVAVDKGVTVVQVLEFPGQRVKVGDVITSIDGQSLSASSCSEWRQVQTFNDLVRHGAVIEVLEGYDDPRESVRFRCPRCWRGFHSWQPCLEHHLRTWHAEQQDQGHELPPARKTREWMAEAHAAANGQLPQPGTAPSSVRHRNWVGEPAVLPPMPSFASASSSSSVAASSAVEPPAQAPLLARQGSEPSPNAQSNMGAVHGLRFKRRPEAPRQDIEEQQTSMTAQSSLDRWRGSPQSPSEQDVQVTTQQDVHLNGNQQQQQQPLVQPPEQPEDENAQIPAEATTSDNHLPAGSAAPPLGSRVEDDDAGAVSDAHSSDSEEVCMMGVQMLSRAKSTQAQPLQTRQASEGLVRQEPSSSCFQAANGETDVSQGAAETELSSTQIEAQLPSQTQSTGEPAGQSNEPALVQAIVQPLADTASAVPAKGQARPKPWRRRAAIPQLRVPPPRSWWAQHFEVHHNRVGAIVFRVAMPGMKVANEDVRSLVTAADMLLNDLRAQNKGRLERPLPVRVSLEVDLANNSIGDAGAVCLFRWLLRCRREVRCRVLRLQENKLGDDAVLWLAEAIRAQHSAVEAMDLSRNPITEVGAAALLAAVALHPCETYPWMTGDGRFEPAWLNLSSTNIEQPAALLTCLKLRAGLRCADRGACNLGNRKDSASFTEAAHVCVVHDNDPVAGDSSAGCSKAPCAVLPSVTLQWIEKLCSEQDTWHAPALRGQLLMPVAPSFCAVAPVPGAPRPARPTQRAMLRLDEEECVAGIECEAADEGLRVAQIFAYPGQPGLRAGDIIVAIDAWPLSPLACSAEDVDQFDRFEQHLRDGATLDVLRQAPQPHDGDSGAGKPKVMAPDASVRFRCPCCWEGYQTWSACLEHLRCNADHAPAQPSNRTGPAEDQAACLRRWMKACSAAASGELPQPASARPKPSQAVDAVLLRIARWQSSRRCPASINHLAMEALRRADAHGCVVWVRHNGLELRSVGKSGIDNAVEEMKEAVRYAFPEVEETPQRMDAKSSDMLDLQQEESDEWGGWSRWMQCMTEQREGEDLHDVIDADRAAGGGSSASSAIRRSLRASAPPFVPQGLAVRAASFRVLVLCGLPGSGKSTLAARLRFELGWTTVNQDDLTSRQACMKAVREALRCPHSRVVIDRCNFDIEQRSRWVQLVVEEFGLTAPELCCAWLDAPLEECNRRVLQRFGHKTLPPQASSLEVIKRFAEIWQPPSSTEGFGLVRQLASDVDIEMFCAELRAGSDEAGCQPVPLDMASCNDSKHPAVAAAAPPPPSLDSHEVRNSLETEGDEAVAPTSDAAAAAAATAAEAPLTPPAAIAAPEEGKPLPAPPVIALGNGEVFFSAPTVATAAAAAVEGQEEKTHSETLADLANEMNEEGRSLQAKTDLEEPPFAEKATQCPQATEDNEAEEPRPAPAVIALGNGEIYFSAPAIAQVAADQAAQAPQETCADLEKEEVKSADMRTGLVDVLEEKALEEPRKEESTEAVQADEHREEEQAEASRSEEALLPTPSMHLTEGKAEEALPAAVAALASCKDGWSASASSAAAPPGSGEASEGMLVTTASCEAQVLPSTSGGLQKEEATPEALLQDTLTFAACLEDVGVGADFWRLPMPTLSDAGLDSSPDRTPVSDRQQESAIAGPEVQESAADFWRVPLLDTALLDDL